MRCADGPDHGFRGCSDSLREPKDGDALACGRATFGSQAPRRALEGGSQSSGGDPPICYGTSVRAVSLSPEWVELWRLIFISLHDID